MASGVPARSELVAEHVPLAPLTTYKLGGPARWLAEVDDLTELRRVSEMVGARAPQVLVLGRGSNVVISDRGFPGLVVRLGAGFNRVEVQEDGVVRSGGSTPLPFLARAAVRAGRGGLEFYVGIPGTVGGAVRMNAGCHGSETVDRLLRAEVVDLMTGEVEERDAGQLGLSYRHSDLGPDDVVVEAWFSSEPVDPEEGRRRMREVTRWRRDNQPGGTLNAGSVFRNPPGDAAGRIIDALGLKGFRVGKVSVSEKHANFFVADPGARAQEVHDLVWAVRRRVGEETGVWLEPEIRFAGPFEPSPDEGVR